MGIFLLLLSLLIHQGESVIVKEYGKRYGSGGMFFNAIICLFSVLFFFIIDKDGLRFPPGLLIYGGISCLMYAAGFYSGYLALKLGSYANTKMIGSAGIIINVVYGTGFLGEPLSAMKIAAIAMIFAAVFLMNYQKADEKKAAFNFKWLIAVIVMVISNAAIGILKKEQQLFFHGACDNEFMILSYIGSVVFLLLFALIGEKGKITDTLKHGTLFGALAGLCNGASNFITLVVYALVPMSVVSPVSAGGGIILSFVISSVIYKEKFTIRQMISAVVCVVALVMFQLA